MFQKAFKKSREEARRRKVLLRCVFIHKKMKKSPNLIFF